MFAITASRRLAAFVAACMAVSLAGVAVAQESSPTLSPEPIPASSSAPSPAPSATPVEARPEGDWDVSVFDPWGGGLVEPRPDTTLTVSFLPEGRLEGETGCGTYFGGYLLDGEHIDMRVISKGPDPCGIKRTEEAVAFSMALDAVASWRPTPTGLELLDEGGAVRVVLEGALHAGIAGDWVAERYTRANGKPAEPLPDSPITIVFGEDGSVSGSTGCRLFEGLYTSERDQVLVVPIETIGLPCEGGERGQERRLLRILDEVVLWERSEASLVLSDGSGMPLLELHETAPAELTEPVGAAG
ncbi:MAG: META domain-containing protein [Chloroflexota bacterium]|nr:META domain-containing protein [Chloroflexota bacterium]